MQAFDKDSLCLIFSMVFRDEDGFLDKESYKKVSLVSKYWNDISKQSLKLFSKIVLRMHSLPPLALKEYLNISECWVILDHKIMKMDDSLFWNEITSKVKILNIVYESQLGNHDIFKSALLKVKHAFPMMESLTIWITKKSPLYKIDCLSLSDLKYLKTFVSINLTEEIGIIFVPSQVNTIVVFGDQFKSLNEGEQAKKNIKSATKTLILFKLFQTFTIRDIMYSIKTLKLEEKICLPPIPKAVGLDVSGIDKSKLYSYDNLEWDIEFISTKRVPNATEIYLNSKLVLSRPELKFTEPVVYDFSLIF